MNQRWVVRLISPPPRPPTRDSTRARRGLRVAERIEHREVAEPVVHRDDEIELRHDVDELGVQADHLEAAAGPEPELSAVTGRAGARRAHEVDPLLGQELAALPYAPAQVQQ